MGLVFSPQHCTINVVERKCCKSLSRSFLDSPWCLAAKWTSRRGPWMYFNLCWGRNQRTTWGASFPSCKWELENWLEHKSPWGRKGDADTLVMIRLLVYSLVGVSTQGLGQPGSKVATSSPAGGSESLSPTNSVAGHLPRQPGSGEGPVSLGAGHLPVPAAVLTLHCSLPSLSLFLFWEGLGHQQEAPPAAPGSVSPGLPPRPRGLLAGSF